MLDELRAILVENLNLSGVDPAGIDPDAPLFGGELGLDSIDALELAIVLEKRFGVKIKAGDDGNAAIFRSLRSLADYLQQHRTR